MRRAALPAAMLAAAALAGCNSTATTTTHTTAKPPAPVNVRQQALAADSHAQANLTVAYMVAAGGPTTNGRHATPFLTGRRLVKLIKSATRPSKNSARATSAADVRTPGVVYVMADSTPNRIHLEAKSQTGQVFSATASAGSERSYRMTSAR